MNEEGKCPVAGHSGIIFSRQRRNEPRLVAQPAELGHPSSARAGLQSEWPRLQLR